MLLGVPNRIDDPKAVQSIIQKLKFSVKIIAFIWKLLHNSFQVKLTFVEIQNETGSQAYGHEESQPMGKRREGLGPKKKRSLAQQNREDMMAQEGPV